VVRAADGWEPELPVSADTDVEGSKMGRVEDSMTIDVATTMSQENSAVVLLDCAQKDLYLVCVRWAC
jgi:hypothetical protein